MRPAHLVRLLRLSFNIMSYLIGHDTDESHNTIQPNKGGLALIVYSYDECSPRGDISGTNLIVLGVPRVIQSSLKIYEKVLFNFRTILSNAMFLFPCLPFPRFGRFFRLFCFWLSSLLKTGYKPLLPCKVQPSKSNTATSFPHPQTQ